MLITAYEIEIIQNILNEKDLVDRIYINFCNPWPKPRHNKKRLTHTKQLEKYKVFLKPGGEIYFKTDDYNLYKATIKILRNKRKRTRQEYRVLKNLLKTYKNRPNFDTNDPYVRILKRKIYSHGQDIEYLNNCENNCREELKKYIDEKDNFYKKIRAIRKRDSNTDLK